MALTFYYLSGSPFAWKVWLALEHKRVKYELRVLSRDGGELATPGFRALNLHGRSPVIDHRGFSLYESTAIIEYIEETFAGRSLWPKGRQARAVARRIQAESDSYLYPPMRRIVGELLLKDNAAPDWHIVAIAANEAAACAGVLASSLREPYFCGQRPCAADFSVYPLAAIMARLSSRLNERELRFKLPEPFLDWRERMSARSIVAATKPPHWSKS